MITLEQAIQFLDLSNENVQDVAIVEQFINETTLLIEYQCNTKILTSEVVNKFVGDNYKYYNLNAYNVNSITLIRYRKTAFDSWTTLANTEYVLTDNYNMYSIVFKDVLKHGYDYEITTSQGVSLDNVPADIQKVAKEMVYIAYRNQSKDILGKSNISESNLGTSIGTSFLDLKPVWRSILKKYTYRALASGY
jgi:hypothetical protein